MRPAVEEDRGFIRPQTAPLLVMVDMQREYVEEGRPLYLHEIDGSLARCKALLDTARARNWDVAHVFWRCSGPLFNPRTPYWEAIDGFHARATSEKVFFKSEPSAYSSETFARMMADRQPAVTYLAGYQGTLACLWTMVDAHERGHDMVFVGDGSHSAATDAAGEAQTHSTLVEIVRQFADVVSVQEVVGENEGTARPMAETGADLMDRPVLAARAV
ncbi:isochorismatase family protein [Kaustia mangrovi]|uniref:Isochorismatase family protein n=1 Tax=Kaustia mangrovi TaxID=2593653 RepID=A0A7S8C207_9HYPH|nr:isochorismatase family protein [Kaustia mangrovi]QPC41904.1 isochorismatase family protein [Kaustia mangrovi]